MSVVTHPGPVFTADSHPSHDPRLDRRRDLALAAAVALAVLVAAALVNARFLATYAVRGDDFALLLHSTRFFPASPGEWMTRGFGGYFNNFPEATQEYTSFLRPTVNASVWLESWLAASPDSPAFLLGSYIGHALCAGLVFLFARWMVRLPRAAALLAALLFAGSASSLDIFLSPAFRGDMLGALFAMSALLLALTIPRRSTESRSAESGVTEDADHGGAMEFDARNDPPMRGRAPRGAMNRASTFRGESFAGARTESPFGSGSDARRFGSGWEARRRTILRVALAVVCLLLAVFAKETAIVAPVIVAAWFLVERGFRAGRWISLALVSPVAVYAIAKLGMQGSGGAYATAAGMHRSIAQTLSSAFFPGAGAFEALGILRGTADLASIDGMRTALALALNAAAFALLAWAVARRKIDRRLVILTVATGAALAVPMLLAPYARLMYLGQMFALPLFVALVWNFPRRMIAPVAAAALLANPAWLGARMMGMQADLAARNEQAKELRRLLASEMRDSTVRRVYLLNDVPGAYGSLAQLRMAALEAGRTDVDLRVVNSMGVFGKLENRALPPVRMTTDGDTLRVSVRCGADCDFSFPGVLPENLGKLGVDGVIRYGRVEPRALDVAIPGASRGDWRVIGFDPSHPRPTVFRPSNEASPGA